VSLRLETTLSENVPEPFGRLEAPGRVSSALDRRSLTSGRDAYATHRSLESRGHRTNAWGIA